MSKELKNFIEQNSPDGGFLQSDEWRKFQEAVGRKTFNICNDNFWASIIEHELPVVGKYFYIPRGPVACHPERSVTESKDQISAQVDSSATLGMTKIIELAKKENAGWIRFDAYDSDIVEFIRKNWQVTKAPHDMQPKEIFLIDITKPEKELMAEMKSKTRYNIKLALKHNVKKIKCEKWQATCDRSIDEFVRLVKITAQRDKITPHPDEFYRKMFGVIPDENLKLYLAELDGKIIAANIVIFYGKVATYLHGASDHNYRNFMAPYLLQWQAMLDAKAAGCEKYDFGGVRSSGSTNLDQNSLKWSDHYDSWAGITKFKTGFSATTVPIKFPGSYDMVINPLRYNLYRILQRIKALF